mmetsp:Transcript_25115/g.59272  ORF Transcript_25115/g.59272 Transcript_25115/m.59272 type:complete len:453 (-) Transcript_25115:14-1372(-)
MAIMETKTTGATKLPRQSILFSCMLLLIQSNRFTSAFHATLNAGKLSFSNIAESGKKASSLRSNADDALDNHGSNELLSESEVLDVASLRSVTFSNIMKDQEPQLLCNFLMELGAASTCIVDADRGTTDEKAIFDEFDETSMTRTAVTTHSWNNCDVSAHFPASVSLDWIMEIVQDTFPNLPRYNNVTIVEDKDWVLHVQQSWKPIILPPFVLRFPWHTDELVAEALAEKNNNDGEVSMDETVELDLQGGIAFGTGEHPTTQLCLEFIHDVVRRPKMLVMDYGAGSGVLGMAACKLEPTTRAVGVDIDVDAVHIANANARTNQVDMKNYLSDLVQTISDSDDESMSIRLQKAYSSSKEDSDSPHEAAESLPADLNGPIYDALAANILAAPLVSLAPYISKLLKPGAPLGLSGIMTSQSEMILNAAYADYFDDLKVEKELGGWVLITGKRKKD